MTDMHMPQPFDSNHFAMQPIAITHSCFTEKFGIPRQPGLAPHATAQLEMLPPYNCYEAVADLQQYSHIWLIYAFHQSIQQGFKATVRPPRLGGNQRMSLFATRSNFRPNPIGLSVVELLSVRHPQSGKIFLDVAGIDLLDQTPILDIKPYLPFSDCVTDATTQFAPSAPDILPVEFTDTALQQCNGYAKTYPTLKQLIIEVLQQDPRPAYQSDPAREYGIKLYDLNIRWQVNHNSVMIIGIDHNNVPD